MHMAYRFCYFQFSDYSDLSSENGEFELQRAPRVFRHRRNPLLELNDRQFKLRFRLGKHMVQELEHRLHTQLRTQTRRNRALNPMFMILLTLRFYATGSFQIVIGDIFNVNKGTAIRDFYNICNFPGVLGAIDCTHIPIVSPGGNNAEIYRNRHGWFSVNVQAVCDSKLSFQNIVARWPGSVHDCNIFRNSRIHAKFEAGEFPQGVLLGDSAYRCCHYLLTPTMHEETHAERAYNRAHRQTRTVIKRSFGVVKRQFPCLRMKLGVKLLRVPPIIVATFILHNLAINADDDTPDVDGAVFGGRLIYQELPVPAVNQGNARENTSLRTAMINNTSRQ